MIPPAGPGVRRIDPDAEAARLAAKRQAATQGITEGDVIVVSTPEGPVRAVVAAVELRGSLVQVTAERAS